MKTLGSLVVTCLLASISFGDWNLNHYRGPFHFAKLRTSKLTETCRSLNKGRNPCDCGSVCKVKKKNDVVQNVKCSDCTNNTNLVCVKSGTCGSNLDVYRYKSCPPGYSFSEHTGTCYFLLSDDLISDGFASADEGCRTFGGGRAADILDATENEFIIDLVRLKSGTSGPISVFFGLHNGILNGEVWSRTGKKKGDNTFENFLSDEEYTDEERCVAIYLETPDADPEKTWLTVSCDAAFFPVVCEADPMCMPMLEDKCSAKPHYSY